MPGCASFKQLSPRLGRRWVRRPGDGGVHEFWSDVCIKPRRKANNLVKMLAERGKRLTSCIETERPLRKEEAISLKERGEKTDSSLLMQGVRSHQICFEHQAHLECIQSLRGGALRASHGAFHTSSSERFEVYGALDA